MRIISVINMSFTRRTKEGSLQRSPVHIMGVAFAASTLAFGAIAFAAGGPTPDVSAALAAAVADPSRPDSDTTRDADRKPEQTLAFSGIHLVAKAGARVSKLPVRGDAHEHERLRGNKERPYEQIGL